MDLLTHILSGAAIGGAIGVNRQKGLPFVFGGIGAALPDIDAISLWSGFDRHIGQIIGLAHSGHDIYFGTWWYSHHALTHSLFACIAATMMVYWVGKKISHNTSLYALSFGFGYLLHLIGDMPTPGSTWDGIALYWPLSYYEGGSGHTWWWNNYDIFLICLAMVIIQMILFFINRILQYNFKKLLSLLVALCGIALCFYQLMNRAYEFDYAGRATDFHVKESQSLKIQEEILGETTYKWMRKFDKAVGLHF